MDILWKRRGKTRDGLVCREKNGVPFLSFGLLEACDFVKQGFSTRMGGVSEGDCASMNLGFSRGDERERVMENYRRMAAALDMPMERMVLSKQTHTTNVRVVTEADAGNGIVRPLPYTDVDGLVTNVENLPLVTFYADCVPLYFVDPVNRAIGLSHSGWRGTVNRMGLHTLNRMAEEYGTKPDQVLACVGPSICRDCYEVSLDVALEFRQAFGEKAELLLDEKPNGKFQLDLWQANRQILLEAGVREEHLAVTDLCTCCNPTLLFSHRASGGKRGNLAAFLCLCSG
ncbi:peptidoglycan editing factor PgeF [Fusibacillus kribbianus]|uniref:Purine nucleoside phosphorylase n=1 Tax=Fusibacillus kribbianus TaxID=3044208 RepID=A0AAP4B8N8_9FIRM|nr:peptidoglycan editing factor PgeF [Ruminococcus sp. YH-rum2234]MDI9241739.1 peptidoglycan editing factor PgeF [Ruminococcus sp. YH-rum2234]